MSLTLVKKQAEYDLYYQLIFFRLGISLDYLSI